MLFIVMFVVIFVSVYASGFSSLQAHRQKIWLNKFSSIVQAVNQFQEFPGYKDTDVWVIRYFDSMPVKWLLECPQMCIYIANSTQRNSHEIQELQCYKWETSAWLLPSFVSTYDYTINYDFTFIPSSLSHYCSVLFYCVSVIII